MYATAFAKLFWSQVSGCKSATWSFIYVSLSFIPLDLCPRISSGRHRRCAKLTRAFKLTVIFVHESAAAMLLNIVQMSELRAGLIRSNTHWNVGNADR